LGEVIRERDALRDKAPTVTLPPLPRIMGYWEFEDGQHGIDSEDFQKWHDKIIAALRAAGVEVSD
jgi:hypothetical protein